MELLLMGISGKLFVKFTKQAEEMSFEHPYRTVWLVLEGDWGGQIYLTVPWCLVGRHAQIPNALAQLDRLAWGCNNGDGSRAYLYQKSDEVLQMEEEDGCCYGVAGGMGGGYLYEDGPWIHEEFLGREVTLFQEELDVIRGISCGEIADMDILGKVVELLDLQLPAGSA